MNLGCKTLGSAGIVTLLVVLAHPAAGGPSRNEARVTRVIRDVKLLPSEAKPRPAAVNDKMKEDTAMRTGQESRSELTFVDLTITRLGSNSMFSFNKAGRNVQLNAGSMLLYVPKNSGGAHMTTSVVSVAITGTTLILESQRSTRNKLTVIEGSARGSLIKYPRESVSVRAGQMIDVPPGATKMPRPVNVDLNKVMKSPLIADFSPLPAQAEVVTAPVGPAGVYPGGPRIVGPFFPPRSPRPGRGGATTVDTPTSPGGETGAPTGHDSGGTGKGPKRNPRDLRPTRGGKPLVSEHATPGTQPTLPPQILKTTGGHPGTGRDSTAPSTKKRKKPGRF